MGWWSQIVLLLWKNWLLMKYGYFSTLLMMSVPVIFISILATSDPDEEVHAPQTFHRVTMTQKLLEEIQPKYVYAPKTTENELLIDLMTSLIHYKYNLNISFTGYPSIKEATDTVFQLVNLSECTIIEFGAKQSPNQLIITFKPIIGMYEDINTDIMYEPRNTYSLDPNYQEDIMLPMQVLLTEAAVNYWLGRNASSPELAIVDVSTQIMADMLSEKESTMLTFVDILTLVMMLSFLVFVVMMTKMVVHEKEKKIKESMKLMGLTSSHYWLSWFITFLVCFLPLMMFYTWALCKPKSFLEYSDPSLVFLVLCLYAIAMITFSFMISSFVEKTGFGAVVAGALYFALYFASVLVHEYRPKDRNVTTQLLGSLLFNTAWYFGALAICTMEIEEKGVQWSNIGDTVHPNDLSFRTTLLMLLLDSVLHGIITWYMDNVKPGEFGIPKPYCFCFSKSYWLGSKQPQHHDQEMQNIPTSKYFQKIPEHLPAGVRILGLTKVFGTHKAVSEVSLNLIQGEITVLIGHNGAGKTTLISMLTGFIPPTSGTAIVVGYDIRTQLKEIHKILGICPQHDILFSSLKVREHLKLFGKLKGCGSNALEEEINDVAEKIGLFPMLDKRAGKLSGGQKRKLCIGMALIGGSQVVILDEPTSGVDPDARRQIWALLQEARKNRTILLTTQYMDEADVLGEKIAIMANGTVQCYGSSHFLKEVYGTGYHLIMVKKPQCDLKHLTQAIEFKVPLAQVENIVNTEISFMLPQDSTNLFPELFNFLDQNMESLNIVNYGITAATMDNVFFQVGQKLIDEASGKVKQQNSTEQKSSIETRKQTGLPETGLPIQDLNLPPNAENQIVPSEVVRASRVDPDISESESILPQLRRVKISATNLDEIDKHFAHKNADFNKGFQKKTETALQKSRISALIVKKLIVIKRTWLFSLVQIILPILLFALFTKNKKDDHIHDVSPRLIYNVSNYGKTVIPYTDGKQPSEANKEFGNIFSKQFEKFHSLEYVNLQELTFDNYTHKRMRELGLRAFQKRMVIGMEVIPADDAILSLVAYYNRYPLHAEATSISHLMNAYLHYMLSDEYSIQFAVHPVKHNIIYTEPPNSYSAFNTAWVVGFAIGISMSFLTAMFAYNPIKERQMGAKQLQFIAGVGPLTYWLTNFVWDLIIYLLTSLPILLVFAVYKTRVYLDHGHWALVILILFSYAWAALPMVYAMQFLFLTPAAGIVTVVVILIVGGAFKVIMLLIELGGMKIAVGFKIMKVILKVTIPMYSFVEAFVNIPMNTVNKEVCKPILPRCKETEHPCCKESCEKLHHCLEFAESIFALKDHGVGMDLIILSLQGVVYTLLIFLREYGLFFFWRRFTVRDYPRRISLSEDTDVEAERRRINSTPPSKLLASDLLVLLNLSKRYGNFLIKPICLGIPKNEIFGLLGQNGAGKTTTFKMLVGDVRPDSGNAYLNGFDIKHNMRKVQTNMGYCPQFDGLMNMMTSKENLFMYARIRGIPEMEIPRIVDNLIARLEILPNGDTQANNLSGGNRRKLSAAVSLIGDPLFILLDEPSCGMDPVAKRNLWSVLSSVSASGRTMMLTSHSMEEVEALCSRLAIMVQGCFVCLGSPQYLKNKFGQGFMIFLKLRTIDSGKHSSREHVMQFISKQFRDTKVVEDQHGYLQVQILDPDVKLGTIFAVLESAKRDHIVVDYSVQQTTLEQVFLNFVAMKKNKTSVL